MMTLTKLKTVAALVAVASLLTTGVFITADRGAHAEDAQRLAPQPGDAQVRNKSTIRVTAAENLLAEIEARERAGDPLTPSFVDLKADAFRYLADARIDAAPDAISRTRAAEQYVQQCRDMLGILQKRLGNDVTRVSIAQGAYHLANAEYLLAKLQSRQ